MDKKQRKQHFTGRLVMLGFGCIGRGVLPLLQRHIELPAERMLIISPNPAEQTLARQLGLPVLACGLTPEDYRQKLTAELQRGDFLLNLSVSVATHALIELCHQLGVLYLDTCIGPWSGGYDDPALSISARSNYALRETTLGLRNRLGPGATAIVNHGANPGLVSHLLKQALLDLARPARVPATREDWARLAQSLGVRCIQIAERDTQLSSTAKAMGEFVNTWSVPGFISEAAQPAEMGWGSHERAMPDDGRRHEFGSQAAIYLQRPGGTTRVYGWTPLSGPQQGFLITHGEAISIADYLSIGDPLAPDYRPTVFYAYHPCDDAVLSLHELVGRHWQPQERQRLLLDDLVGGMDALGVLLMGQEGDAYWYGSQLSVEQARALCPRNSATSLQVTASVMAGVVWAMRNPQRGIVEPDEMPFEPILELCRPYLGKLGGTFTDWTPLQGRRALFPEDLDYDDPWQFRNFRVL
ncbi:Homospermidine synthase [compost metagenome]